MAERTLVSIFPGPGPDTYRVRELAPGTSQVQTLKWAGSFDAAVEYIRENYSDNEAIAPDDFRSEVRGRKGGK
jgi:hypothetical protein